MLTSSTVLLVLSLILGSTITPPGETERKPGPRERIGAPEGTVRLGGGPVQPPRQVENTTDPEVCGQLQSLDDLLVSPDRRGLANVIVSLVGSALEGFPVTEPDYLVLDNRLCRFVPHAAVLTVGSTLELTNSDRTLHTVHLHGPSEENVSLPFKGMKVTRRLTREGIYQIKCDVHGWMQAFLRVDAHPFHAVTDPRGAFRIPDIPWGNYILEAWHERFGFSRSQVEIHAGKTTGVELEFPSSGTLVRH